MPEPRERTTSRDIKWHEWTTDILTQLMDLNTRYETLSKQIAEKYDSMEQEFQSKIDELAEQTERNTKSIMGGSDPSKGLVIRLDRLEQNESRREWWLKSTLAACITAIVTAVFSLFKKMGP